MSILLIVLLHPVPVMTIHALLVHILRARVSSQLSAAIAAAAGTLLACVFETVLECRMGRLDPLTVLYVVLATSASGYCYFHVFNMTETSRRVKLLSMLSARGAASVDEQSDPAYSVDEILRIRLRRLERLGQIRRAGSRYVLSGRTLLGAARAVHGLERLLGFDRPSPSAPRPA